MAINHFLPSSRWMQQGIGCFRELADSSEDDGLRLRNAETD